MGSPPPVATLGTVQQRGFLGVVLLQFIIVAALESGVFAYSQKRVNVISTQQIRTLLCHFVFLMSGHLNQLILTIKYMWGSDILPLWWMCFLQIGLLFVGSWQIPEARNAIRDVACGVGVHNSCEAFESWWGIVRPCVITMTVVHGLALPIILLFLLMLGRDFGWEWPYIADIGHRGSFHNYKICQLYLTFDFIVSVPLAAELLILAYDGSHISPTMGLSIAGLAVAFAIVLLGYLGGRFEITWFTITSMVLMPILQAYFVWRFSRFFAPSTKHDYLDIRASLSIQTIIAFYLLCETFYFSWASLRAYGQEDLQRLKRGEPEPSLRRSWRVGQSRPDFNQTPPWTAKSALYYADGDPMKERAPIV